jgi:hypothetical protein
LLKVSAQSVIRLLSVSDPMLETLPLTPLAVLYGWSAGSSLGGSDANTCAAAKPATTTAAKTVVTTPGCFICPPSLCLV